MFQFLTTQNPKNYKSTAFLITTIYKCDNLDELNKFVLDIAKTRGTVPKLNLGVFHEVYEVGLTLCQFSDGTLHLTSNPYTLESPSREDAIDEALAEFLPGSRRSTESPTRATNVLRGENPIDIIKHYSRSISIRKENEAALRMMLKSNSTDQEWIKEAAEKQRKSNYLNSLSSEETDTSMET